jgi:outer membrane protein OmpA-like peptidoglycan-associated protein
LSALVFPQPIVFGTRLEDWDDLAAETSASNERILSQIVQILNTNSTYKVRVEGHANPTVDPSNMASRQYEYTEELQPISEVRAKAVMNRLVTLGIDPGRLEYRGLGGEHPLVAWEDTENWGKNRRVEFILIR